MFENLFSDVENPIFIYKEGSTRELVYQNFAAEHLLSKGVSLEEAEQAGRVSQSRFDLEGVHYIRCLVLMEKETEAETLDYLVHNRALRKVLDQSDSYLLLTACASGNILFANTPFLEATGLTHGEMRQKTAAQAVDLLWGASLSSKPELHNIFQFEDKLSLPEDRKYEKMEIDFHHPINGKWYFLRGGLMKWVGDEDVYVLAVQDITARKHKEEQLEIEAMTDAMTGIGNRELGRLLLMRMLEDQGSQLANTLVFIDVDQLKSVNDRFGHDAGDWLIRKVVDTIKAHIRKSDVFCRWGGDEFILVIQADEIQTHKIMDKIQWLLEQYNQSPESKFNLSFSYGTIPIPHESNVTVEELVSQADRRMYQVKNRKKHVRKFSRIPAHGA
jgi:diguanylate cyclase (GGDEF)-like protein